MKFRHIKRALLWVIELTKTLLIFWFKNPSETKAVLTLVSEKLLISPKFLAKNVLIEKQETNFSNTLKRTINLYKNYGKEFDPSDPDSYQVLESLLDSKLQLLYFLIRKIKPKTVLETGVAAGESTGFILRALNDNRRGKLYSIDLPFQWYIYGKHKLHLDSLPAGKQSGYLVEKHLKKNWNLYLGNTHEVLPELLKNLKVIDIFLHDSEHTDKTMLFEYKTSWPHIKKSGVLLSDDVSYTSAFANFTKSIKEKSIIFKDLGICIKSK